MNEIVNLKYCPRVRLKSKWKPWKLKAPTRNCMFIGSSLNHMRDEEIYGTCLCHAWVPSGLIRYCKLKKIPLAIGKCPNFRCVLNPSVDSSNCQPSEGEPVAKAGDAPPEPDGSVAKAKGGNPL